jgi:hypothetical protein
VYDAEGMQKDESVDELPEADPNHFWIRVDATLRLDTLRKKSSARSESIEQYMGGRPSAS